MFDRTVNSRSSSEKTLLILGADTMQIPAFHECQELGIPVVTIDFLNSAEGSVLAKKFYTCDLADFDTILSIAKENEVDGVMTLAADYPVPTVAQVCEKLNLTGLGVTAARISTNKAKMRRALQKAKISIPQWKETTTVKQAEEAVHNIDSLVVFKPVDSSGGRGVTLIRPSSTTEDIHGAFKRALSFSRVRRVLVEQFISGKEVSVEAITYQGITKIINITDKLTTEAPFFVEIGHSQPSQLPPDEVESIKELTIAGIKAIGIDNSPSHTEIRLGLNGPRIIEIGARLGGGFITSHLVPLSTGINLVKANVLLALGQAPNLQPTREQGAAIRFLNPKPGRVFSISGIDRAQEVEGIQEIVVNVDVGDYVPSLMDATGRIGYVICEGSDAMTAVQNAEKAAQLISITTK